MWKVAQRIGASDNPFRFLRLEGDQEGVEILSLHTLRSGPPAEGWDHPPPDDGAIVDEHVVGRPIFNADVTVHLEGVWEFHSLLPSRCIYTHRPFTENGPWLADGTTPRCPEAENNVTIVVCLYPVSPCCRAVLPMILTLCAVTLLPIPNMNREKNVGMNLAIRHPSHST